MPGSTPGRGADLILLYLITWGGSPTAGDKALKMPTVWVRIPPALRIIAMPYLTLYIIFGCLNVIAERLCIREECGFSAVMAFFYSLFFWPIFLIKDCTIKIFTGKYPKNYWQRL